jgi:hypothetical protein
MIDMGGPHTLAYMKANYAWLEQSGIAANPAFLNASGLYNVATDFELGPTSPCIGAGVDVDIATDYAGLLFKDPPSIGAYEKYILGMICRIKIG